MQDTEIRKHGGETFMQTPNDMSEAICPSIMDYGH